MGPGQPYRKWACDDLQPLVVCGALLLGIPIRSLVCRNPRKYFSTFIHEKYYQSIMDPNLTRKFSARSFPVTASHIAIII
jgi:hypothetical protein